MLHLRDPLVGHRSHPLLRYALPIVQQQSLRVMFTEKLLLQTGLTPICTSW